MVAGLRAAPAPARAAIFTVTNLNDAGAGSLRGAVGLANAAAGADEIVFNAGLTGTMECATALGAAFTEQRARALEAKQAAK